MVQQRKQLQHIHSPKLEICNWSFLGNSPYTSFFCSIRKWRSPSHETWVTSLNMVQYQQEIVLRRRWKGGKTQRVCFYGMPTREAQMFSFTFYLEGYQKEGPWHGIEIPHKKVLSSLLSLWPTKCRGSESNGKPKTSRKWLNHYFVGRRNLKKNFPEM